MWPHCGRVTARSTTFASFGFAQDRFYDRAMRPQQSYWLKEGTPVGLIAYWKLDETEGFIVHDIAGDLMEGKSTALWSLIEWTAMAVRRLC